MDANNALARLDLKEKEILVYKALLELGEVPVPQVSKKTGIKRPTTYMVLKSLESKGFASHAIRGKKMLFAAQHPMKLITEAEIRLKELQEAVPHLESMMTSGGVRPRVVVYEGKESLNHAYDDLFITKGENLYIGHIPLSQEVFARSFQKLHYMNFSPEFSSREIVDGSTESRNYADHARGDYRKIRFLPKDLLPFQTDLCVFGDTVLVTSIRDEYFSIKIESTHIAQAFRSLF